MIFDFRISIDGMNEEEMKQRTKKFALRVLDLADAVRHNRSGNVIAAQIIRSGTSVAANYRALCRAKSRADFINKTSIVEEEADETGLWLELLIERGFAVCASRSAFVERGKRTNGNIRGQPQNGDFAADENRKSKIENS
jgi:four helix bundle protein